MADVENQQDSSFPVKRKSDLCCQDQDNVANKAQKLNPSSSSADSESKDGQVNGSGVENLSSSTDEKLVTESSLEKAAEENKQEVEEEDEEEEEEDLIEAEIDRKGKGIAREDKGKGKLIEFDESDDSDDDDNEDDEDVDEYDESDLSDDPLAEVDLDNILPSRTRRRSIQPGVFISNDRIGNHEDDDDDDSSDDSDA
ncbi:uncharacterized protein LOC108810944 [Raphanus sativus]|uniref:Uncharacterized protein LOC108810944 n=1 Tax=Raphanus sativus TaxID=3726 RepID=A0A6J0JNY5_RAPSA|nr:uncharacterized protein LOC108810944 [Raphanus sativus]